MRRLQEHSAEHALTALLDALAPVLIPLDITPDRLAQIARVAFVKASANQAQLKTSGRPHLARIAAVTGLSRAEVKRVVASNYRTEAFDPDCAPRALRVLSGWRNSKVYSTRGKPKALRIVGASPSFESLCKAHSGDIPYTVILDELERRRCIVFSRKRRWVAVAAALSKSTLHSREHAALMFATSFVRDALRHDTLLVRRKERVATSRDLPDAYVENAIAGRITDLLDQLPELFARKNRPKRNILNVFALVARNPQSR
jgi:Family of unknown function (DUF6502)